MKHYVTLKEENKDRLLLYRLGDFFECFFEDAVLISNLLEITLTSKDAGKEIGKIPMAGVPYHAMERYCCLLYTSPSPRDRQKSRMPSSA